jgi:hypothetical protein
MDTQQSVPAGQCSSTPVGFCQGFLSKEQRDHGHPPYSPNMAPADFYLYPRLKLAMKRRRFCEATEINKNATEELRSVPQNCFQECFQHVSKR